MALVLGTEPFFLGDYFMQLFLSSLTNLIKGFLSYFLSPSGQFFVIFALVFFIVVVVFRWLRY